jgi:hypothetical protein
VSPSIWFLGIAVVASVLGTAVIAWRHRSPQGFDTSINDFNRRMSTLAPAQRPDDNDDAKVYPADVAPAEESPVTEMPEDGSDGS